MSASRRPTPQTKTSETRVAREVTSLLEAWETERPGLDMSSLRISLPLRRAMEGAETRRAVILARHNVTPAMLDLLVALRRSGPPYVRTPSELARALVLSAGGVSQRLERLEQVGLIERQNDVQDRRVVYVRLTDKGLRALDALIDEYMDHEERLLAGLTQRERDQLARLLLRLNASIAESDADVDD